MNFTKVLNFGKVWSHRPYIIHKNLVIFKVTRVIFKVTRVIFKVTRVILKVTRVILKVTRVIFKVTRVIFKVTRVIFKVTRVIFKVTRVKLILDLLPSVFQPFKSFLQVWLCLWIGGFDEKEVEMEGEGDLREEEGGFFGNL